MKQRLEVVKEGVEKRTDLSVHDMTFRGERHAFKLKAHKKGATLIWEKPGTDFMSDLLGINTEIRFGVPRRWYDRFFKGAFEKRIKRRIAFVKNQFAEVEALERSISSES